MAVDFSKKMLVFVTGASRGIGRSITLEIAQIVNPKSTFILIASSQKGLDETVELVSKVNSSINVITHALDLSYPSFESYQKLFQVLLKNVDLTDLACSIFIHNAGTVGVLKNSTELTDEEVWRKYYNLNVISAVALNTSFVKTVRGLAGRLIIINISSLCGKLPFPNMSMYGSVKAARELFFKVFAVEEPDVLVLNYSPGPVDTDMFAEVSENADSDKLREQFQETRNQKALLTPKQTVQKMLGILKSGDFTSGVTIDYYDR